MALEQVTRCLNSLLRGELAAIETYNQALERIDSLEAHDKLTLIAQDHQVAAGLLRRQITEHGGEPSQRSGPWGVWAKFVTGSAKVLGEESVLKVLKEGEEHGLKEYQDAIGKSDLDGDCRDIVLNDLMPKQERHIPVLDEFLKAS